MSRPHQETDYLFKLLIFGILPRQAFSILGVARTELAAYKQLISKEILRLPKDNQWHRSISKTAFILRSSFVFLHFGSA